MTVVHQRPEGSRLVYELAVLPGMSWELSLRVVRDGNWPADAGELARKYGLMQMDADEVLKVLNRNRGTP